MFKLSFFQLEDLPDEVLLIIFSWLDIKGVLQCGQVSRKLRAISNDKLLWLKLNLFQRDVPYGFIEKAVQNGCEYLNLGFSCVHGGRGKKSKVPWKLKYLEISQSCDLPLWARAVPKGVLENCQALQKLSVEYLTLNSDEIEQICQNGEVLRILNLEGCKIDFHHRTELLQKLFTKCRQLTELNISKGMQSAESEMFGFGHILLDPHVCALVDNLTPNILKLGLDSQECVQDRHVNTLVRRCNKITDLDLRHTSITNDSVGSIVKHLNSLEKLDVGGTNIDVSTLTQLRSISTLKTLHCLSRDKEDSEKIKNLKLQLPQVSINEEYLHIACSTKEVNGHIDPDWFWEIRAKKQDLFLEAHQ